MATVVVLGGYTRPGDRRARRSVIAALNEGFDVTWVDSFEDTHSGRRVELSSIDSETSLENERLEIIEARTAFEAIFRSSRRFKLATVVGRSNSSQLQAVARFIRRLNQIGRSRRMDYVVRPIVEKILAEGKLSVLVYCDDFALPTAFWVSRHSEKIEIRSSWRMSGK